MRILIWLLILGGFLWALRDLAGGRTQERRKGQGKGEEMVRDPNCGVYVPVSSAVKKKIRGRTFYFCSKKCEEAFKGQPGV